jgi:hypothetical protein
MPRLPHSPVLRSLRQHLLEWRANIENALHERRNLVMHLAQRVGKSEELNRLLLTLILDIVLEVLWIEEQLLDYVDQITQRHD